jgi:hypothetical protein
MNTPVIKRMMRLVQICHIPNLFEPHSEQNLDVSLKYGAPHSSQNFAGLGGCAASYNSA